jgi:class 3 adenylate cyclase
VSTTLPLPDDPMLRVAAETLEAVGFVAEVWDRDWRLAYLTSDYLVASGGGQPERGPLAVGEHLTAPSTIDARLGWKAGPTLGSIRGSLAAWGAYVLGPGPDARERLRAVADPRLHDVIDELDPAPTPMLWQDTAEVRYGTQSIRLDGVWLRLDAEDGAVAGAALVVKPAVRGAVLGMLALGDERLFERMLEFVVPQRRPVAILFADLEGSTALSRRLSAAEYFALLRRLTREIDAQVVGSGGIVGKHAGDGVTAFFLADGAGEESRAAAGALRAVEGIRAAARDVAARSGLDAGEVVMRFGVHWGATVHVGRLLTAGRIEVTAIGDEVNEAARIEACATGGRALVSKALLERLTGGDAEALGIEPARVRYTTLAELPTASEKARRDAPALSVCEL